ncbi:MAG: site-specific integrase [Desulfovibrionaceae bacterium]|nr:site-specific integrase [Desulfovibrionaceae bacterium]
MAIRNRKTGQYPWQVYWNNPFTHKRESKSYATEREAQEADSMIRHRLKFDPESFRPLEEPEETTTELTVEDAFVLYMKNKQYSVRETRHVFTIFKRLSPYYGDMLISDVDKTLFTDIQKGLAKEGVKDTSIHHYLTVLKRFLNWTIEHDLRPPLEKITLSNGVCEKFVTPTQQELTLMYEHAHPMIKRLIIIGAYCGVRTGESEMLQLQWADVNFNDNILRVHGSHKNKNAPWRDVPIQSTIKPLLEQWRLEDGDKYTYIIHQEASDKALRYQACQILWKQMLNSTGITRRIRMYDLRHYFGTELVAAGVDIGTVAQLMGHSNPIMLLKHYQYVKSQQKVAAIEKLPTMCLENVPE